MHVSDAEEFKTELGKLCAGFEVPLTKAREQAYWTSLARMSIAQFRRCVEHALGPDYAGKDFPRTGEIWDIHKATTIAPPAPQKAPSAADHLEYYANRLLWLHISHRGGLGSVGRFAQGHVVDCQASQELQACLTFKRELLEEFSRYILEGDECATPGAFFRMWLGGLRKISEVLPRTVTDLEHLAGEPDSQVPFQAFMARPLTQGALMTDASIEAEIQAKGLTAPRITPADIEANIAEEYTFTAAAALKGTPGEVSQSCKLLTLCVLVLKNGFTVTGESACASPENFDAELGAKIARGHARDKIWPLMGYALKAQLAKP